MRKKRGGDEEAMGFGEAYCSVQTSFSIHPPILVRIIYLPFLMPRDADLF